MLTCCCPWAVKNLLLLLVCSVSIPLDYITINIFATKQFINFVIHSGELCINKGDKTHKIIYGKQIELNVSNKFDFQVTVHRDIFL